MPSYPPPFTEPKLNEIDSALAELDPTFEEFARVHGFTFLRGTSGCFNVPRRWLRRRTLNLSQGIDLVIALPMLERLERGFFPAIPCTVYIRAQNHDTNRWRHTNIVEARPFDELSHSLAQCLADAGATLDAYTPDFVTQHGDPVFPPKP